MFEHAPGLVRLYPIPLRYLDDERVFKKYQWIEAYVRKATDDPRPESYRIRADGIETRGRILTKSGNWDARAEWIMRPEHIFQSVEALQAQEAATRTSLGLIKPREIINIVAERFPKKERDVFWETYRRMLDVLELPLDPGTGRKKKPLTPPAFRFKVRFRCSDARCLRPHEFSVLDWEIDALYFKLNASRRNPDRAAAEVVEHLRDRVCSPAQDLYLFLGNIAAHPHIFTIVGLWYPKKATTPKQLPMGV